MSDLVDLAQAQNECLDRFQQQTRKPAAPPPTGFCLNCAEPVLEEQRWCGVECRDEWDRMDTILRKQGL